MKTRISTIAERNIRTILVLIFLLTGLSSQKILASDITLAFDNSLGNADHLLGSRLIEGTSYGSSSFTLSSILSDRVRAYIDLSHLQVYPQTNYSSNEAEIGFQFRYLEIQDNQIFSGLYSFINRYHDNYSYYNSNGIGLYLKWKHYFRTTQLIISGYDLNLNQFPEVSEASNTDHEFYVTYNQSFPSKTSLNFRNSFAYQDFWNDVYALEQIPNNQLLRSELRLSQSLNVKIGLTAWLSYQEILNDNAGLLAWQDANDNPFIDRFRWSGPSSSVRLNYRINPRNALKVSYSIREKSYLDVPVYAYDFENQEYVIQDEAYVNLGMDRSDENQSIQLNWNLILDRSLGQWVPGVEVVLSAGWTKNSSNDLIYDYQSKNYSITLNINN